MNMTTDADHGASLTEKAARLREGLEREFPDVRFAVEHKDDTFEVTLTDPNTGRSGPLLNERANVCLGHGESVSVMLGKARNWVRLWLAG